MMIGPIVRYYYHFDGLGSVIALSNIGGNVVERYSYDVFGEPNRVSDVNNPYLFTGRRYDDETGLYYYRARYYDHYTGRFLQTDPIGYYGGFNLYTYCGNNPLNWIDPFGLVTGVEEATAVSVFAGWGWGGYMTVGGTYISGTGVGALVVGTVAAAGGTGYGLSKYAICPLIDKIAMDYLYDCIVNPEMKKGRRTGKIVPGTEEIHNVQHGKWPPGHRHWVEKHTDPKTGKERLVRRHGPPDDSTPKTGQEQEDNSGGVGFITSPKDKKKI